MLGMSENGVYPQWNSHLVGIMISKTIGYNGVHNIFRQTQMSEIIWNNTLIYQQFGHVRIFFVYKNTFPLRFLKKKNSRYLQPPNKKATVQDGDRPDNGGGYRWLVRIQAGSGIIHPVQ